MGDVAREGEKMGVKLCEPRKCVCVKICKHVALNECKLGEKYCFLQSSLSFLHLSNGNDQFKNDYLIFFYQPLVLNLIYKWNKCIGTYWHV